MSKEATPPDPVELTHRGYASLNRRDLDAFVGLLARSCVYDLSRFDLGTHRGPEAIRGFYEEWIGPLYEYGVEVDDIKDLGNGVIYAFQVGHRGSSPHLSLELEGGVVGVWEGGKLARMTVYPDSQEALSVAEDLAAQRSTHGRQPKGKARARRA
jgi:ketosteroid isomerase-like protein